MCRFSREGLIIKKIRGITLGFDSGVRDAIVLAGTDALVYVCMCIYIYTYIRTYIHTYMHACMHACIDTCVHALIHVCIHVCMYACVDGCMDVWMYA